MGKTEKIVGSIVESTEVLSGNISEQDERIIGSIIEGVLGADITYEYRHDFANPMDYIGKAVTGSLDSDSAWTITRNEYFLGGAVITKTATDVKWTERTILIYN